MSQTDKFDPNWKEDKELIGELFDAEEFEHAWKEMTTLSVQEEVDLMKSLFPRTYIGL